MAYKRILVPVDGSPTAAAGLKAAISLARETGAVLHLVHVVDEQAAFAYPDGGVSIGPIIDSLKAGGRKILQRAGKSAAAAGVRAEVRLVVNFGQRIADGVVKEARRARCDLIAMGTHGRRGVRRALLGSDAELVLRLSQVPVLLIPPRRRR